MTKNSVGKRLFESYKSSAGNILYLKQIDFEQLKLVYYHILRFQQLNDKISNQGPVLKNL